MKASEERQLQAAIFGTGSVYVYGAENTEPTAIQHGGVPLVALTKSLETPIRHCRDFFVKMAGFRLNLTAS
jgi:hypothetical protein